MNKSEIQDYVSEYNEEALLADGFEEAFLGICDRFGQPPLLAYDREKCLDILMQQFQEDNEVDQSQLYEEAIEFFEYNVIGAWMGENTPVFLTTCPNQRRGWLWKIKRLGKQLGLGQLQQ